MHLFALSCLLRESVREDVLALSDGEGDGEYGLPHPAPAFFTTAAMLDDVIDELVEQPRYAIDTEFHRERT